MVDQDRFEPFFEKRYAQLVRACFLVLLDRGKAEEVASEAFTVLWQRWPDLANEDHAGGYVYTTAIRLCSKRLMRSSRELVGDIPEVARSDDAEAAASKREVFTALAELPPRQRQSIVLRDWAGFETDEVAEMLDLDASTVRVHLARGRAAMRARLSTKEQQP